MADPTAADKETARRLMTEGRTYRKAGDSKSALKSFQAADDIMHVPTTALEVGRTEVELGQLVEARDTLLAIARLPAAPKEPRAFVEARATAKTLAGELEGRIPSIKLTIQGVPADGVVTVQVDDVPIPAAALGVPRAVDPGHHVISGSLGAGSAGGTAPHTTAVDLTEGETKEVTLDMAAPLVSDEAPAAKPPSAPTDTWRLVSYVGFGVGGAALLVGSITGIVAISDLSSAKKMGCVGNQCPPSADGELNTAGTFATVSTVGFVLAAAGVGAGAVGFILSRHHEKAAAATPASPSATPLDEPPPGPATDVSLYFGPGSAGIRGTF
jgi:hypothetical protein